MWQVHEIEVCDSKKIFVIKSEVQAFAAQKVNKI